MKLFIVQSFAVLLLLPLLFYLRNTTERKVHDKDEMVGACKMLEGREKHRYEKSVGKLEGGWGNLEELFVDGGIIKRVSKMGCRLDLYRSGGGPVRTLETTIVKALVSKKTGHFLGT
jgi:hypothetical protein